MRTKKIVLRKRIRKFLLNEMDYEKNYYDLGVAMEKIGDNASSCITRKPRVADE